MRETGPLIPHLYHSSTTFHLKMEKKKTIWLPNLLIKTLTETDAKQHQNTYRSYKNHTTPSLPWPYPDLTPFPVFPIFPFIFPWPNTKTVVKRNHITSLTFHPWPFNILPTQHHTCKGLCHTAGTSPATSRRLPGRRHWRTSCTGCAGRAGWPRAWWTSQGKWGRWAASPGCPWCSSPPRAAWSPTQSSSPPGVTEKPLLIHEKRIKKHVKEDWGTLTVVLYLSSGYLRLVFVSQCFSDSCARW